MHKLCLFFILCSFCAIVQAQNEGAYFLTIKSVTCHNKKSLGTQDELRVIVNNEECEVIKFDENETKSYDKFGKFASGKYGGFIMSLEEVDLFNNDELGDGLPIMTDRNMLNEIQSEFFEGFGYKYEVKFVITE